MDVLALKRPRLWVHITVCALAAALGWRCAALGLPALILPGMLAGLAMAVASPDARRSAHAVALAVSGGIGSVIGGFALHAHPAGTGFAAALVLAARGALYGGWTGVALGMALSSRRYRWGELAWLLPVACYWLAVHWFSLDGVLAGRELGVSLVAFAAWLFVWKRDGAGLTLLGCGAAGFAVAFPVAQLAGGGQGMLMGLLGGAGLGLGACVLDEDLACQEEAGWRPTTSLGLLTVVWLAPFGVAAHASHSVWGAAGLGVAAGAVLLACGPLFLVRPPYRMTRSMAAAALVWLLAACGLLLFVVGETASVVQTVFSALLIAGLAMWAGWQTLRMAPLDAR